MIDLEQTRQLQTHVQKAIAIIESLKKENEMLRRKLVEYERRVGELEVNVSNYNQEQSEIEKGILTALDQLDRLEDDIAEEGDTDNHEAKLRAEQGHNKVTMDPEQTTAPHAQGAAAGDSVAENPDTRANGKLGIFR